MAAKKKIANKLDVKKAREVPIVDDSLKRLTAIEQAGKLVSSKRSEVESQDTKCGNIKSRLEDERESLSILRKEQRELEDDLLNLSRGGFSERLKFPDPKSTTAGPAAANTAAAPQDDNAWKSLTLEQMGLTNKRALSALTAAHLDTFGKAEEHLGTQFSKPIPNFGEAARQAYDDAKIAYFLKNPQPVAAKQNDKPHTAAGDKPGTATRGVDREKKALILDVQNAIAFATLEATDANVAKVLTKMIGSDPTAALETATLEYVGELRLKARGLSEGDLKSAIQQHA